MKPEWGKCHHLENQVEHWAISSTHSNCLTAFACNHRGHTCTDKKPKKARLHDSLLLLLLSHSSRVRLCATHRRQPARLPHPWGSPGKNTGVGCRFLLQCMKVKLFSRVWLLATPWTAAYQAPPSMGFSRREYWSGLSLPSPVTV